MRIASIYLPSFPLQAALASAPVVSASAAPIAVIGGSVVAACSRAAWAVGVRPGMVVSVARSHAADLVCLLRDPAGEAELVRTLADALLALTPSIDLGGPVRGQRRDVLQNWALFVEVPAGKRGSAFGARVVEIAAGLGLKVRVGIADDRFTAAVAASHGVKDLAGEVAVTCVPRGGAAAFLAPLPLGLLNLPPEVQHMLEALGVRTLGAFAELPPPSVARAWDADLQALSRGDGGDVFDAYQPTPRLFDRVAIGAAGLGAAIQHVAERLAARLTGRGAVRADVEVRLGNAQVGPLVELIAPYDADAIADDLSRVLGGESEAIDASAGTLALHVLAHQDEDDEAEVVAPAPVAEPAPEIAPLVLTPVPSMLGHRPEHRRTRRGKQRPRIASGQARLFARES